MWKVVVKYYYMLGNIFRIYQKQVFQTLFIAISYPKNATFVIANSPKFWFSVAFVLALCNTFGVKQCQNGLVFQSQKLVKFVFICSAAAVDPLV